MSPTLSGSRLTRMVILGLSISSLAMQVDCPNSNQSPQVTCSDFGMFVVPGTCERFSNPCAGGQWVDPNASLPDGFALLDRPDSVYVRRDVTDGEVTRSICVAPGSGTIGNRSIVFKYGHDTFDRGYLFGTGHMTLYSAPRLTATVSATPSTIDSGGTSQLVATVSGGIPPYSYSWIPSSGLTATNIPTPRASPSVTTTYEFMLTDSGGQSLGMTPGRLHPPVVTVPETVTVSVNFDLLSVTANPPVIAPGDFSQLTAQVRGGRSPFTYLWSPADSLDRAEVPNPLAQPAATTPYTVTVRDANGQTRAGSVILGVSDLVVNALATPAVIKPGASAQLDVILEGGSPPYSFSWTPTQGLDRPTVSNPVATPAETTRYTVTVTDASGIASPHGSDVVAVFVSDLEVTLSASPSTITAGGSSQLTATIQGGQPPFSVAWHPPDGGLDNRNSLTPVATPANTTTYSAQVCDVHIPGDPICLVPTVTVTVNAEPPPTPAPTASFTFTRVPCTPLIPCSDGTTSGQEVFFDGSASTGTIVSFAWDLQWTPPNPDLVTAGPMASVILPEGTPRSNVVLTVTAADGRTATFTRRFP